MSNVATIKPAADAIETVLIKGDLSVLSSQQRVEYIDRICAVTGLNSLTRPFEYTNFQGRLVLYARKEAAEQLRKIYKVSIKIVSRETIGDVYVITAHASMPDGREDESTGAIVTAGLKGEALANAMMKAETKAKRRVTLSICGLGMLDESEVESMRTVADESKAKQITNAINDGEPEVIEPEPEEPPAPAEKPLCRLCGGEMLISKSGKGYYCPNFKDESNGKHSLFKVGDLDAYLRGEL